MTLTPNGRRSAVELSLPVLTTRVCRSWDSNTQHSTYGANAFNNCPTAAALLVGNFYLDKNAMGASLTCLRAVVLVPACVELYMFIAEARAFSASAFY